jgi:hypothetical protein
MASSRPRQFGGKVGEQRKKRARVIWRFGEPVGTRLLPQEHSSCLDHHRRSLPISTLSHGSLLHTKLFHHLRISHLTFPSLLRCVVNRCMHGLPVINNIAFCEIHPLQLLLICFFCTTRIEQKSLSTASHCDIYYWLAAFGACFWSCTTLFTANRTPSYLSAFRPVSCTHQDIQSPTHIRASSTSVSSFKVIHNQPRITRSVLSAHSHALIPLTTALGITHTGRHDIHPSQLLSFDIFWLITGYRSSQRDLYLTTV